MSMKITSTGLYFIQNMKISKDELFEILSKIYPVLHLCQFPENCRFSEESQFLKNQVMEILPIIALVLIAYIFTNDKSLRQSNGCLRKDCL